MNNEFQRIIGESISKQTFLSEHEKKMQRFSLSLLFPLVCSPQSEVRSPRFTLTVFVLAVSDLYLL